MAGLHNPVRLDVCETGHSRHSVLAHTLDYGGNEGPASPQEDLKFYPAIQGDTAALCPNFSPCSQRKPNLLKPPTNKALQPGGQGEAQLTPHLSLWNPVMLSIAYGEVCSQEQASKVYPYFA